MATPSKIKDLILDIASRPESVTTSEIERVMRMLADFDKVTVSEDLYRKVWCIAGAFFSVCAPNKGNKHLKSAYVKEFLSAMMKTGWYE